MVITTKKEWQSSTKQSGLQKREGTVPSIKWIIPLSVSGPEAFTLIAVWSWQPKGSKTRGYVKVIRKALDEHPEWLAIAPAVMAGDFNSHWKWTKSQQTTFLSLVADLTNRGLLSAYHLHHLESAGSEKRPTFHQTKRRTSPTTSIPFSFGAKAPCKAPPVECSR